MQSSLSFPHPAKVIEILVEQGQQVEKGQALLVLQRTEQNHVETSTSTKIQESNNQNMLSAMLHRKEQTLDSVRTEALERRHQKGFKSARENLALLCDADGFQEYGQFAVAAQRQREDYEILKSSTAADGIITGVGQVNADTASDASTALIINDYSVLAGTQGFFHHQKLKPSTRAVRRIY